MVQKPFWTVEQHERIWIHVCDFIYTYSKKSVSTQSIFIAVLAMIFFGGGYILKGHIKIDSRNRLNWSPRLNVWFKEFSTTNFMFMYEKLYNLIWKCHEVFFYTILNVFPKREKLKYLKYIRLRLQDHHRSFEHASVYRINRIQNVFFIRDHKEMSWWQPSFTPHYQLTLTTSASLVCEYKKQIHSLLIKSSTHLLRRWRCRNVKYVTCIFFLSFKQHPKHGIAAWNYKILNWALVIYTDCLNVN